MTDKKNDEKYEAKFKEMQKYAPFLQRVIEKLKISNDERGDNPRKAQLEKMEMLHGLLTNQAKKLKMETLLKCEGVLIKLHAKIEKNEDLSDMTSCSTRLTATTSVPTSCSTKSTASTSASTSTKSTATLISSSQASNISKGSDKNVSSAPASPSPERAMDDDVPPVVIPTERRISHDSDDKTMPSCTNTKEKEHKSRSHEHRHRHQHQDLQRSKDLPKHEEQRKFPDTRDRDQRIANPPNQRNEGEKQKLGFHPSPVQQSLGAWTAHNSPSDRNSPLSHHRISKDLHNYSTSKHQQQQHSLNKKEAASVPSKSNSSSIVQTVKVVITEPLPANIAKRHFPPYHQYRYQQPQNSPPSRDQRCLHNIEINPAEPKSDPEKRSPNDEAYNPDESWEKYNVAEKNSKKQSMKPIFQRLGEIVPDEPNVSAESHTKSSPISIPRRNTSIPEVLKSPPLSATDINNLLKESGAEHVSSDISEIGSRRTKKPESNDSKCSLDYVRKKFAQIAKINSPQVRESTPPSAEIKSVEKNYTPAPSPNERLALKYNPHPRQERLQSISSNDGSECSHQSTTRLNTNDPRLKLKIQASPSSLPPVGVNVLPSINVNDPRLKRQSPLSTTATSHCHLGMAISNTMPISSIPSPSIVSNYVRQDPRISRQLSQPPATTPPPVRRMSVSQPYISPKQNWESDTEEHINKNDPRISRGTQRQVSTTSERPSQVTPPIHRKIIGQFSELPATTLKAYTPNPLPNNSEENWDSDNVPISTVVNETILSNTNLNKSDPRFSRDKQWQSQHVIPPIRRQSISQPRDLPIDQMFIPNVPMHDNERNWDSKPGVIPTMARDTSLVNNNTMSRNSSFVPFGGQSQQPPYLGNPYGTMSTLPNTTPPPLIPFSTQSHFVHGNTCPSTGNRFNSALNDSKERTRYFESKKQKSNEARTYIEFKKAKERAQAMEAANRKAVAEAQVAEKRKMDDTQAAMKKASEEKTKKDSEQQDKTKTKSAEPHGRQQPDKMGSTKIKDLAATPAGESTLDKMYRTQNFNTQFPKSSLSFKIPKKKSEDNPKSNTTVKDINKKAEEKKAQAQEQPPNKSQDKPVITNNNAKPKKAAGQKIPPETTALKPPQKKYTPNPPKEDGAEENWDSDKESETISSTLASDNSITVHEDNAVPDKIDDNKSDLSIANAGKSNSRDPRCRPKEHQEPLEKEHNKKNENQKTVENIEEGALKECKTSLKEKTNTNKFLDDSISHSFSSNTEFKPQRILRRRCTMVSFGSAPLVDKDKLLKANALMLEDIEERDKLKRKKEEEERHNARRNKQLAEMFQKTDDNCSVSTQNIITGKRRTRPSINFNETRNAMNVFKHICVTKKESQAPVTPPTQAAPCKTTRSRGKQKAVEENPSSNENTEEPAEGETSAETELHNSEKLEAARKVTARDKTDNKREKEEKFIDEKLNANESNKPTENPNKKNANEKDSRKNEELNESLKEKSKAEESSAQNEDSTEKVTETEQEIPKLKMSCKKGKNVKPENPENKQAFDIDQPTTSKATTPAPEIESAAKAFEEHQNCVVSSSTSIEMPSEEITPTSAAISRLKEEVDDNEPSSTGSKTSNPTPTPPEDESSRHAFLNEFVQEIIKPNADKQHILSLLGQILSEDKLQIIKTVIDSTIKETEEDKNDEESAKSSESKVQNKVHKGEKKVETVKHEEESVVEDEDDDDDSPLTLLKTSKSGRSTPNVKKKRNELDRLNDDIRDMFICEGVLTASGKRMCTLMSQTTSKKDADSPANKRPTATTTKTEDTSGKKKIGPSKTTKPMSKPLRRSLRGCKTTEVSFENANDDEVEITTYIGCGDLTDEINATDANNTIDTTPTRRKMPVLKPHTPIKLPEETEVLNLNKDSCNKRKQPNKPCPKSKKTKQGGNDSEKDSETECGTNSAESDDDIVQSTNSDNIKNTNVHWHNQSKYTTWCTLCDKRIQAVSSSFHYKMHHGENYISRLAPVLLPKFKQGKMCQPLFGVDRPPKQPLWFHRCPFCLQYFNTAVPLWLEHFLNHTAEFRYECSKCHWGSNRVASTRRHIATTRRDIGKSCKGASIVNSAVKLTDPSVIKAHVCHLCNFIQLKRPNLERHYIEQHQLSTKNVDLLGYTITLFDHSDVERVSEDKALAKEEKARQLIAKDEKIIDVDDFDNDDDGDKQESEELEENDKVKKVNKESKMNQEKIDKKNEEKQTEKDSTTAPETEKESDIPKEQTQSKKEIVAKNTSQSPEDKTKTTEAKSINLGGKVARTAKTIVKPESLQKPIENNIDESDTGTSPPVKITIQKVTPTSPTTKAILSKVVNPTKEVTPIKSPDTTTTPSKVTETAKLSNTTSTSSNVATTPVKVSTPPKAQVTIQKVYPAQHETRNRKSEADAEEAKPTEADDEIDPLMIVNKEVITTTSPKEQPVIAKPTLLKVYPTQKDTRKRKSEADSERAKPTETGDDIDPLMIVNKEEITTTSSVKPPTPKKKTESVGDLLNNTTNVNIIPESPTVQIAARKYTLVLSEGDQCSLNEVPEKSKKTFPAFNCEIINKDDDAKEVQDELLSLAAQVAEEQENKDTTERNASDNMMDIQIVEDAVPATIDVVHNNDEQDVQDELLSLAAQAANDLVEPNDIVVDSSSDQNRTQRGNGPTMSDLISGSIDMLFQRSKRKSDDTEEPQVMYKKHCSSNQSHLSATSNVFIPSRLGTSSPPIQILAQSIVNIEEQDKVLEAPHKVVTTSIAERLSQRFKVLQEKAKALKETQTKERVNQNECPVEGSKLTTENLKLKDIQDSHKSLNTVSKTKEPTKVPVTDEVTVISDDEDWEDIEITESAPNTGNNLQKAKSKGLFQKFGLFKSNTIKAKKHIAPLGFMPKKKTTKEKTMQQHSTSSSPITTKSANADKPPSASMSPAAHLGFKPVTNIMEDLLTDSIDCNDPIDLVPELTPLEPLTDLNDISSILDSNLSALGLHIEESHTCIQDALDFISEQTANEHQSDKMITQAGQAQTKSPINKIQNVGFSLQSQKDNSVKFYCLLQNCSFLFSSDAMGLENHFFCEHAQIKWKGYCQLCQAQCFSNDQEYSISKEIKHMVEKHVNRQIVEPNSDSSQHSAITGQGGEERPRIKLRRMTGDCLSTSNSESPTPSSNSAQQSANITTTTPKSNTLLGALLNAKPMPPTKEMPPQPLMPLTEPLLIDNTLIEPTPSLSPFTNVSNDFVITSVASGHQAQNKSNQHKPLQIASVVSLNEQQEPSVLPKISNVCTLSSKTGQMWAQQIEEEKQELLESAVTSLEVSNILANARKQSYKREPARRSQDDSPGPVVVAETLPVLQATAGDFVITQTVSAQYGDDSAAAVGFNISIQASALPNIGEETANILENVESSNTTGDGNVPSIASSPSPLVMTESVPVQLFNTPINTSPVDVTPPPITSRQYKCMGNGCKFTTRVPVAMSDHLRFHERRNLSLKCDYFACAFCSYQADDVDDYMKHSDQYHIISKVNKPTPSENDAAVSAPVSSRNICDILSKKMETNANRISASSAEIQRNSIEKQKEIEEEYLKKLRTTINEIVGATGLPDDKLYRCVIKNCRTQLTEATFHNHILYHISTLGISNPNNYIFKCPHCTAQYHRPAGIKAHIKNHARNRYFCYLCEVTSANPVQMLKHFCDKHWQTHNMTTKELLKPNVITNPDGKQVQDSCYYVAYTNEMSDAEVRKYGEKLILEWQRKKSGSKTHFKSSEIDLLPIQPIFQREVNCGECEYKTKVRTNMYRHLLMHKQQPNTTGQTAVVASVDPVNPVPCLNSTERFFDKMTNLASSSLIPSQSSSNSSTASKSGYKFPRAFIADSDRFKCGIPDCNYVTISADIFHSHLSTLHASAVFYRCPFCQEELCKRGMSVERVLSHLRFHASTLFRCEECNYTHYLRYVVERHVNEKHSTLKVNIVRHERTEGNVEGKMTTVSFIGKNYKDNPEANQSPSSTSSTIPATRSSTGADVNTKSSISMSSSSNAKTKAKWICDICKHKASTLAQIQMHCQNSHGQNKPYQCMHCQFGSQQLSQILYHVDETHPDKTRNARYIYHKMANDQELDVEETRPLWQRNDPKRVRHIRGILMEDEEESEKYRKKVIDDEDDNDENDDEDAADASSQNFIRGYEFGCFHCDFKCEKFDELISNHYPSAHCSLEEMTKPFMFRLLRRVCCPECRKFTGNFYEMQLHLLNTHNIRHYYAADIAIAENDDNSQRLVCGYCSFHCSKPDLLMKHFQSAKVLQSHSPQDVRIESHLQMLDILKLGTSQTYFQCTLCSQIFGNRVSIVHHAVNFHANDDGFSFKEQTNTIIYQCALCSFSSTTESTLLRHMIDHYGRFKRCNFCYSGQISFEHYMQHCYAEHREDIRKFRDLYPYKDISNFLLQMCLLFPNGLMLSKKNLLKTRYGSDTAIQFFYEEMYKISQQPPIPRLSIARLVARKSIEAHHKQSSANSSPQHAVEIITDDVNPIITPTTSQAKKITKRRCTVAIGQDEDNGRSITPASNKISKSTTESSFINIGKKRKPSLVVEHESSSNQSSEFNVPLVHAMRIKKRRRTVASDHNENSPSPYSSPQSFVIEGNITSKESEPENAPSALSISPAPSTKEKSSLDLEYFSYYGIKSETLDLSKVYTKVAIGGINTPLTIDKFRLLFNMDCQLKLTKCDVSDVPVYTQYKHIKKACPASHKLRFS